MNDRKQGPSLEDIDLREISAIIDRLEQSRFNYLDLRVGDLHITVGESAPSRPEGIASAAVSAGSSAATTASSPSLPPPAPGPAGSTSASSAGVASASPAAPADATPVRSPMVGRFYAQPEPGAAPFVRLGQRIEAGTTVGLVEVMKVFNAVTADVAGEVVALPVQDGEFVEFDQPIAWVRAGLMAAPLRRLLVANRGEIALRIIRSCRRLGIETVLASSSVDRDSLPARRADRTVCIGPGEAARSYLHIPSLIAAATGTGCDAVHPGYGFLAESEAFAQACEDAGLRFVGPTPTQIAAMGNKLRARELAQQCGLPLLPGSARVDSPEDASAAVAQIGFPVMLKAAAGGGGRGMKIVSEPSALAASFVAAAGEARAAFGDPSLYVERYVENARHVEVQVLGDGQGQVVQLGERDCSVQRRHQKLVEEAPAPGLSPTLRDQLRAAAVRLAASMSYRGAGTVEFLVDADREAFYFLEMNTRIQVEHPVTEMVTGIDLVAAQLGVAAHEPLGVEQGALRLEGHAIECRINAEDPAQGFRPSPGLITRWDVPGGPGVRLDSHCESGYRVPPHYDSLLGKLIVHAPTREAAVAGMRAALAEFGIEGVRTTLPFLDRVLADADFAAGRVNTRLVDRLLAA